VEKDPQQRRRDSALVGRTPKEAGGNTLHHSLGPDAMEGGADEGKGTVEDADRESPQEERRHRLEGRGRRRHE